MKNKRNVLFIGVCLVAVFIIMGAILSPDAVIERKELKEERNALRDEGFIKISDEDTWFTWECSQSLVSKNGETISIATAIGENMIGKCDTLLNEYYKLCPEGVVFSNYGEDDTCK